VTTTATRAAAPATGRTGGGTLAGTGALLRFILRRDRLRIAAWVAALAAVQVGGAASYPDLYPTLADRENQAAIVGDNPAMKAMSGPGFGLDDYTYGAMMTNEYLGFMAIFVALMSVLMLVRHTRTEEETGRVELVRASVVGRHAPLTAALIGVALTNLALGLLIALGMGGLGIESIDWSGSFAFGAAYAMVGLVFAGVAAVTVQLTGYARSASGLAGALIGVAYAVRAIGDVADNGLSWLSPIGWAQAMAPYVHNNLWPLLLGWRPWRRWWRWRSGWPTGGTPAPGCGPTGPGGRPPRRHWVRRSDSPGGCSVRVCSGGRSRCSGSGWRTGRRWT
jgi:ABC-2 type transport system permease protein